MSEDEKYKTPDERYRVVHEDRPGTYLIWCPGCKIPHVFDSRWSFNGDFDKPTFKPSMLVNKSYPESRCHSFVTDGEIRFLGDCAHELKDQTVPLEAFQW